MVDFWSQVFIFNYEELNIKDISILIRERYLMNQGQLNRVKKPFSKLQNRYTCTILSQNAISARMTLSRNITSATDSIN